MALDRQAAAFFRTIQCKRRDDGVTAGLHAASQTIEIGLAIGCVGLAAVPVWAWLLLAGAVLLGLAVLVERRGGGVAATREVVDVVLRRYR